MSEPVSRHKIRAFYKNVSRHPLVWSIVLLLGLEAFMTLAFCAYWVYQAEIIAGAQVCQKGSVEEQFTPDNMLAYGFTSDMNTLTAMLIGGLLIAATIIHVARSKGRKDE